MEELRANRESTTVVREIASLESAGMVKPARTEATIDATANQTATIVRDIRFVTINAAVRIPAQLLAPPQPTAPKNENEREMIMEVATEATTARTTRDRGTSTTITPTNKWGRHGFIVAEVYKVLASMEPPWGSLCVYNEMARRFLDIDPTAL